MSVAISNSMVTFYIMDKKDAVIGHKHSIVGLTSSELEDKKIFNHDWPKIAIKGNNHKHIKIWLSLGKTYETASSTMIGKYFIVSTKNLGSIV